MKILQLHVDFIEYKPIKKEIQSAEESSTDLVRMEDLVVLFTSVEKGDDAEIARKAVNEAKEFLAKLGTDRVLIYPFAHLSNDLARPADALQVLVEMEKDARAAGLDVSRSPFGWNKAYQIKVKGHPLAEMSRNYVRGGASPAKPKPAERKAPDLSLMKRSDHSGLPETDHRIIGERLDLFSFQESSPGMVYWHDKGLKLWKQLLEFIRAEEAKRGYIELSTPTLANSALWKVSGHWDYYKDNMFVTSLGDEEFALKPMNCPSTMLYYNTRKWSFRDLPLRVACFDHLYRNELSGVASGLFRVKMLTQDDAHIFAAREQAKDVIKELLEMTVEIYKVFGFGEFEVRLSTMPDDHAGTLEEWEEATGILRDVLTEKGLKFSVLEKDGSFYAPKIDIDIKDSLGRKWQCTTIQLDYQLPKRFDVTYTGSDGKDHPAVVIHRAILGSLERFIGILLEHHKGKLPIWLSPVQSVVIPVTDEQLTYAKEVLGTMKASGILAEGAFQTGTMGSKIREAQVMKVPTMVIVGEKEVRARTISVRERDGTQLNDLALEEFLKGLRSRIARFE